MTYVEYLFIFYKKIHGDIIYYVVYGFLYKSS